MSLYALWLLICAWSTVLLGCYSVWIFWSAGNLPADLSLLSNGLERQKLLFYKLLGILVLVLIVVLAPSTLLVLMSSVFFFGTVLLTTVLSFSGKLNDSRLRVWFLFLAANGLIVWPHYSSAVTAINLIPVTLALLLIGDHLHKRSVRPRIFAVSFIAAAVYVLVSLNAIPSTGLAATRIGMNVVAVTVVLLLLVYGLRRTSARAVFVFLSLIAVALSSLLIALIEHCGYPCAEAVGEFCPSDI